MGKITLPREGCAELVVSRVGRNFTPNFGDVTLDEPIVS